MSFGFAKMFRFLFTHTYFYFCIDGYDDNSWEPDSFNLPENYLFSF